MSRVRRLSRVRRRFRGWALRVHRVISLVLGLWMIAMATTGSVLVVLGEANQLARPDAYHRSAGDRGPVAAVDSAIEGAQLAHSDGHTDAHRGAHARLQLTRLTTPVEFEGVYRVDLVDERGLERRFTVDPGTARLNGEVTREVEVLRIVRRLHTGLLRDSWFGVNAQRVVAAMGVVWLASLLAGAWVWWWPRPKAAAPRRLRRGHARHRHRRLAALVGVPLGVVVLSGTTLQFGTELRPVWNVATLGTDQARPTRANTTPVGVETIDWQLAESVSAEVAAGGKLLTVEVPRSPIQPYRMRYLLGSTTFGLLSGSRVVSVEVDQYEGRIIAVTDPLADSAATQGYEDWMRPLHVGTFGGPTSRVMWVLLGAATVMTAWTGLASWRKRRPRAAERRASLRLAALATAVIGASSITSCARGELVAAPPTTPSTLNASSVLSPTDETEIREALARSSEFAAPFDDRLAYLSDSEDLREVADRVAVLAQSYSAEVAVVEVFAGPRSGEATALVDVSVGGSVLLDDGPVPLQRRDGRWLVTRVGVCTIIALVAPCPPSPQGKVR